MPVYLAGNFRQASCQLMGQYSVGRDPFSVELLDSLDLSCLEAGQVAVYLFNTVNSFEFWDKGEQRKVNFLKTFRL
ncbi:MAG: hypothetical protein ACE14T_01520 [Syntrophales bacterium]